MSVFGKVIQVAGPAVDVEFPEGQIPVIRTAIRITSEIGRASCRERV